MTKVFLLVSMPDLDKCGNIPLFGSPITFFVRPELGDRLLDTSVYNTERLDEMYCIVETSPERAEAIAAAITVIGKARIKRSVRTLIKATIPHGSKWIQYTRPT